MERKKRKRVSQKRKFYTILGRFFAVLVICMLLINLVVPSKGFSDKENRSLQTRPKFSIASLRSGDFFKEFDSYYSDQFVFRDAWMSLSSYADQLEGRKESGGVYLGKNGYLLGNPDSINKEAMANTTEAINLFRNRHSDMNMYMLVAPAAASVLTDKLPALAPVYDQKQGISEYQKNIFDMTLLDAVTPLVNNKNKYIYYKTDHHWTSLGAYTVFESVAGDMGLDTSGISYTSHLVTAGFQGTQASKTGRFSSRDEITVYEAEGTDIEYIVYYPDTEERKATMFETENLDVKDKYLLFFGGNHPVVDIRTTADNSRNLLIFKDSYANSFVQFLYPYFNRIVMIDPRYYYDNIETAMTSYGITDVLFLYSADTLFTDKNLADTLGASLE